MKKAAVLSILSAVVLLAVAVIAEAQQPKKVPRIGYLSSGDAATESARSEPIRLALRERGFIEGQNIATEYRYGEGKPDRYPELAAELVLRQRRYHRGSRRFLVDSGCHECDQDDSHRYDRRWDRSRRGRPRGKPCPSGGNVTGITNLVAELGGKRLELLKEAVPKLAVSRFSTIRPFRPVCSR
jgi:hypothetical protein